MKTVTWPQVTLILGLCAGAILAGHFAGPMASSIVSSVGIVLAWLTDGPASLLKKPEGPQ